LLGTSLVQDAIDRIRDAAQDNNATSSDLPWATYQAAGVTGSSADNLASFNSALDDPDVGADQVNSTANIQNLVNAYDKILTIADSQANSPIGATTPSATDYQKIGINGVDAGDETKLLGEVIDRKAAAQVNLVSKIQNLASTVEAVLALAGGSSSNTVTDSIRNDPNLTNARLNDLLGTQQVITDNNRENVLQEIARTPDANLNGYSTFQGVVAKAVAFDILQKAAEKNNADSPVPPTSATGYAASVPSAVTYTTAGAVSVNNNNFKSYNDVLNTKLGDPISSAGGTGPITLPEINNLVSAYNKVLAAADSGTAKASSLPAAADYAALQVSGFASAADAGFTGQIASTLFTNKVALLGDAIDLRSSSEVDQVAELQVLANTAGQIISWAALDPTQSALTGTIRTQAISDLNKLLGGSTVTDANLNGLYSRIVDTSNDGEGVNTVQEIRDLVTAATGAVDNTGPKVTTVSIQSATKNGTGGFSKVIDQGDVITFAVNLDEAAIVTGTPTIGFYMGSAISNSTANNRSAFYDSTSPDGKTLFFKYTVKTRGRGTSSTENDFDHDGLTYNVNSISLPSGASIKDSSGNDAVLTYSSSSTPNTNYRVDALALSGTGNDLLIRGEQDSNGSWYFFFDSTSPGGGGTVPDGRAESEDSVSRLVVNTAISGHNGATPAPDFTVQLTSRTELQSIRTTSSNAWPSEWLPSSNFSSTFYHTSDTSSELLIVRSTTPSSVDLFGDSTSNAYAAFKVIA